jgi:hypothetical protein
MLTARKRVNDAIEMARGFAERGDVESGFGVVFNALYELRDALPANAECECCGVSGCHGECHDDSDVRDEDEADYRDRSREAWASRGW